MEENNLNKKNLQEVYGKLAAIIASEGFLCNQGLNNEVPFHICPYDPALQVDVSQMVRQLTNHLEDNNVPVLNINLYDLAIEVLQAEGDWDWILENESSMTKSELRDELQGILDIETVVIPAITKRISASRFKVLLITGVGEVFPYIRSHNILNNLQKQAKDFPTLMFFPGRYEHTLEQGASLELFGKLQEDNYYRAFNILDRAV
ncbi:DUF1788 domain-containing protein [Halioglobus japonicus]|uniref:DUF1788 domain-containing protein n=1 Tax=Halioglobus japonicus TaxID=930805 RepID=A0AAP8MHP6_9GAMM|nr:DUF1788 domain-containing protein [Halioglobus japonicus]PLW88018.1 DUF1788 domain-containing protein [Halioglobus japonicus]